MDIERAFSDRTEEIDSYLELLRALERDVQSGVPHIGTTPIQVPQQRMMYSSLFLQLYNLIEATATWCIDSVTAATAENGQWQPKDLSPDVRREWIRNQTKNAQPLDEQNRLERFEQICDRLIHDQPMSNWSMEVAGGGNWDDQLLEKIGERIGIQWNIRPDVHRAVKKYIKDNKGALKLVKDLRNRLAHGSVSFSECSENMTVSDLSDLAHSVQQYLREVIRHFCNFVSQFEFLEPGRRPRGGLINDHGN